MTLIGVNLVAKFAMGNYKNELAKCFITEGGSSTQKGDIKDLTAKWYELFMMTYFWAFCVNSSRLKKIREMQSQMAKELDIGKLFDKLDQENLDEFEFKPENKTQKGLERNI